MIRIEYRAAYQREHLAIARIHSDDGAVVTFERLFRCDLHIEIDGQLERFAGNGGCVGVGGAADFPAVAIDQSAPLAVFADEHVVILLLHA